MQEREAVQNTIIERHGLQKFFMYANYQACASFTGSLQGIDLRKLALARLASMRVGASICP